MTGRSAGRSGGGPAGESVATHSADTTAVHGITDTSTLLVNGQTAVAGLGVAAEATRQLLVKGQATTDTVLAVRGVASQSGNLLELQDSTSAAVMKFGVDKSIQAGFFMPIDTPGTGSYFSFNSNSAFCVQRSNGAVIFQVRGASGQTGDLFQCHDGSAIVASVTAAGKGDFNVAGVRTKHNAAATPTGGASGDLQVGNSKIWVNDGGTWKSVAVA